MIKQVESAAHRRKLLDEIARLAEIAIFGTLSETCRTCGQAISGFVTSTTAPIATGRSEPVPGRVCPRCGPAPFHGAPENGVTGEVDCGEEQ